MNSMRLCLAHLCSFWLKIDVSHCAHSLWRLYKCTYFNSVASNLVCAWLNIVSKHEPTKYQHILQYTAVCEWFDYTMDVCLYR